MTARRECPACGSLTDAPTCCGVSFDRPFVMTKPRIVAVRRLAHGRKGLDDATYRLHLQAVGAPSTTTLTREQYDRLVTRLNRLPDAPRPQGRVGTQ